MICNEIQKLINYSIKSGLIEKEDEYVIRNQIMDALCVYDWEEPKVMENNFWKAARAIAAVIIKHVGG